MAAQLPPLLVLIYTLFGSVPVLKDKKIANHVDDADG